MDRYERMRSGDWREDAGRPNFPRMAGPRLTQGQREWIADGARIALALGVLAVLAQFIR